MGSGSCNEETNDNFSCNKKYTHLQMGFVIGDAFKNKPNLYHTTQLIVSKCACKMIAPKPNKYTKI